LHATVGFARFVSGQFQKQSHLPTTRKERPLTTDFLLPQEGITLIQISNLPTLGATLPKAQSRSHHHKNEN
jgi:hypothetical protein